jgi:hypothetical protein
MSGPTVMSEVNRCITFAYVTNKMAPAAVIAQAVAERVKDLVNR